MHAGAGDLYRDPASRERSTLGPSPRRDRTRELPHPAAVRGRRASARREPWETDRRVSTKAEDGTKRKRPGRPDLVHSGRPDRSRGESRPSPPPPHAPQLRTTVHPARPMARHPKRHYSTNGLEVGVLQSQLSLNLSGERCLGCGLESGIRRTEDMCERRQELYSKVKYKVK